ncbi:MAG TPA: hypothetical protein VHE14_01550, partial [Solirubrobacteraceae bacterium]|nr:hypothetical protein [Solirubrobacteraceae bacterium]
MRALRAAGYEPWVAASGPEAYAARSRAAAGVIPVPESGAEPERFVEGLHTAAEELGISVLLGGTERDLVAIARGRNRLGALATGTPELDSVLRITSKKIVNELAVQIGLKVPSTIEVDRGRLNAGNGIALPVFLKPLRSELDTSEGGLIHAETQLINTQHELRQVAQTLRGERWLLQEYVQGRLGAICGVAWNGAIVCAVHQRAERIWPADVGVSAYARTVPPDPVLQDAVARLVSALG